MITTKIIFMFLFSDSLCICYIPKGLYTCLFRIYRKNWAVKCSKYPGENCASSGGIDIHDHVPFTMLSYNKVLDSSITIKQYMHLITRDRLKYEIVFTSYIIRYCVRLLLGNKGQLPIAPPKAKEKL